MKKISHAFCITLIASCFTASLLSKSKARNQAASSEIITPITKTPIKGIDIQKVMDYPMDKIIKRYRKDYKVSKKKAALHEQELKRYFILCAEYNAEPLDMLSTEVDNLWHTFLLFTIDYQAFCNEMFGYFLHHVPKIEEDSKKI